MKPLRWTFLARNAVGVCLAATGLAWLCGGWNCGFELWQAWIFNGWKCAAWLLGAFGLGVFAQEKVFERAAHSGALALAFGIAMLLVIDQWLGSLGILHGVIAIVALIPGWVLTLQFVLRQQNYKKQDHANVNWWWPACIAMAALFVAASVSPGVLWSTEFAGYDALSYHLQAPKEWMAIEAIRPLEFMAYAAMPNFVEGGFLHVMCFSNDARDGAVACQLLHASMLLVAAFVLADTAAMIAREVGLHEGVAKVGALCAIMGTPWLIVTGSLAYSESGIVLAFASILNVMARAPRSLTWGATMLGVFVGVLVGSKASSILLVLPAIVAWHVLRRNSAWIHWKSLVWSALALIIGLTPWLARNWYYTGAPLFPFATTFMGAGWWSGEQCARWNLAHASDASLMQRALALWNQLFIFGVGENPKLGEPWRWFWGPLPWIGAGSLVALSVRPATRPVAMALSVCSALIVLGWIFATHLQSRFLVPLSVPLSLGVGLACARMAAGAVGGSTWTAGAVRHGHVSLLLCAWACLPAWSLATDTPNALYFIGQNQYFEGEIDWQDLRSKDAVLRAAAQKNSTAELVMNYWRPQWRVLSVGWSAPFWIRPGAPLTWSSVWDRNAIEACDGLSVAETTALLEKNFDAILLDVPMLERWQRSGWLSPKINLDQLKALSKSLPHVAQLTGGKILLGLRGNSVLDLPAVD